MNPLIKRLFAIGIPIMITGFLTGAVNLVDLLMIGELGETDIAAVGLASQFIQLTMMTAYAINGAGVVFIAQFNASSDTLSIKKIYSLCVAITAMCGLIIGLAVVLFPQLLLGLYTADAMVIQPAAAYLSTVSPAIFFMAMSIAITQSLTAIGITKPAMVTCFIGLIINIVGNYLFIFGLFGFRPMGVEGAALATVIARAVELALLVVILKYKDYPLIFRLQYLINAKRALLRSYRAVALPIMASYLSWILGITLLMGIYARMGTSELVAMSIFSSIERIVFTGVVALGSAAGVLIGQELGLRKSIRARLMARKISIYTLSFGIFLALLLSFAIEPLLTLYRLTSDTQAITATILRLFCLLLPVATLNTVNMIGILRAGGATKAVFVIDLVCMWAITLPLVAAGYLNHYPLIFIYIVAVGSGEFCKLILSLRQLIKHNWAITLASVKPNTRKSYSELNSEQSHPDVQV